MDQSFTEIAIECFRVREIIRVRFNEIDGQEIVFNGNYLIYADIGMTEYFRALGKIQPGPYFNQYGTDIREKHVEIIYHDHARLDDEIIVAARIAEFEQVQFTLHCAIFRAGKRLADILIRYAHLDSESGRPAILPGSFISEVRRFEAILPLSTLLAR